MTAVEALQDMVGRLGPGDEAWVEEDGVVVGLEVSDDHHLSVTVRVIGRRLCVDTIRDIAGALRRWLDVAVEDGDADLAWALAVVIGLSAHERAAMMRRAA